MAEPPVIYRSSGVAIGVLHSQVGSQSSDSIDSVAPEDKPNGFNSCQNNAVDPGRAGAGLGVVDELNAIDGVFPGKMELSVAEVEGNSTAEVEEKPIQCSEKCALMIRMTNQDAIIAISPHGKRVSNGDGNCVETQGKRREIDGQKEKQPRRRGGDGAKKNKEASVYYSCERNEKRLQYSIQEIEALRYEQLAYQRKKWIEVFSGLDPLVAHEYEGLVQAEKIHRKQDSPSLDFDPRPQFLKSAYQSQDCGRDHSENLETIEGLAVEGDCDQEDDSDDDYSSIQKPAFAVAGEPDFDSGPVQDGLEYLRRVRWEAARIPNVKVVKVDKIKKQSVYMPQIPGIMKCPEILLPLKEWEDSFLADFSELRLRFSASSSIEVESVHEMDILVNKLDCTYSEEVDVLTSTDDPCPSEDSGILETTDQVNSSHFVANSNSSHLPTLSQILRMEPAARTLMLRRRINLVEKMSSVPRDDGLWLFALCAAVDCPLDADTGAAMRSLLRKCASLRAAKTKVDDDELIILNILVTITGRYFGQLEK